MQIAYPLQETRIAAMVRIACDRCKTEVPFERSSYLEVLKGWVCCHRFISDHGGAVQLPPFKSVADAAVPLPVKDELHICPTCWSTIEKLAQPTPAAQPSAPATRYFVVSDYAGEQGHLPGGDPREHGEPFPSYSAAAAFVDEARKRGDLDYRDVRIEARPA